MANAPCVNFQSVGGRISPNVAAIRGNREVPPAYLIAGAVANYVSSVLIAVGRENTLRI